MKKFISKLGFAVSVFALVFGAVTLNSCQKESISYVIPGTDLSTVEELLDQIKTYLLNEQDAKLQELIDAIAGEDDSIKTQLNDVIEEIKLNNKTDFEIKILLERILMVLDPHYNPHYNPHAHGNGYNAGGGLTGK